MTSPDVKGPKSLPVLGHIPQLAKNTFEFFFETQRKYGDVFAYQMGANRVFFVAHPDDIKYVLQDNYKNYVKHSFYDVVKPLVGEGLLTSEGETWLRNRRLAQPVFHRQKIHRFADMMVDRTQEMLDKRWASFAKADTVFDLQDEMMRLTLTIVGDALFSTDVSDDADEVSRSLNFALEHTNDRTMAPVKLPLSVPTPKNKRFQKSIASLDELIYKLIEERREAKEDKADLLSMLLSAEDADTAERMNDKQLRDEAMTLFLAGHETTATTLTWTFYLLGQHTNVIQKLRAEVDGVLEGRKAKLEDYPKLSYTRQVLDESLRLYPPAWMIGRHALNNDVLPSGAEIPAGQDISISTYVTHRHEAFWKNPEGFNPDRFSSENSEGRHRFAYLPFGAGPRICIGNNFALMEMVFALATVIQNYDVELVSGQKIEPEPGITMRPKQGLKIRLKARV